MRELFVEPRFFERYFRARNFQRSSRVSKPEISWSQATGVYLGRRRAILRAWFWILLRRSFWDELAERKLIEPYSRTGLITCLYRWRSVSDLVPQSVPRRHLRMLRREWARLIISVKWTLKVTLFLFRCLPPWHLIYKRWHPIVHLIGRVAFVSAQQYVRANAYTRTQK